MSDVFVDDETPGPVDEAVEFDAPAWTRPARRAARRPAVALAFSVVLHGGVCAALVWTFGHDAGPTSALKAGSGGDGKVVGGLEIRPPKPSEVTESTVPLTQESVRPVDPDVVPDRPPEEPSSFSGSELVSPLPAGDNSVPGPNVVFAPGPLGRHAVRPYRLATKSSGQPEPAPVGSPLVTPPAEPPTSGEGGDGRSDGPPIPAAENEPPIYPPDARRRGQEGTVLLNIEVTTEGAVGDVSIDTTSGYPALDGAAMAAVKQWRFKPHIAAGRPAACRLSLPVHFALRG